MCPNRRKRKTINRVFSLQVRWDTIVHLIVHGFKTNLGHIGPFLVPSRCAPKHTGIETEHQARLLRGVTLLALFRAVHIEPEASGNPRLLKVARCIVQGGVYAWAKPRGVPGVYTVLWASLYQQQ